MKRAIPFLLLALLLAGTARADDPAVRDWGLLELAVRAGDVRAARTLDQRLRQSLDRLPPKWAEPWRLQLDFLDVALREERGAHRMALEAGPGLRKRARAVRNGGLEFMAEALMMRAAGAAGESREAARLLGEARRSLDKAQMAGKTVALFVLETEAFREDLDRGVVLSDPEFLERHDQAWLPLRKPDLFASGTLWQWALEDAGVWLDEGLSRLLVAEPGSAEEKALAEAMLGDARSLGSAAVLGTAFVHPEIPVGVLDLYLVAMARLREAGKLAEARKGMDALREFLEKAAPSVRQGVEKAAAEKFRPAGVDVDFQRTRMARGLARSHREAARLVMAEGGPGTVVKGHLEKARAAYDDSDDPLERMRQQETAVEVLLRYRPPGWEGEAAKAAAVVEDPLLKTLLQAEVEAASSGPAAGIRRLEPALALARKNRSPLAARLEDRLVEFQVEAGSAQDALALLSQGSREQSAQDLGDGALAEARVRTERLEQEIDAEKTLPADLRDTREVSRKEGELAESRAEFYALQDRLREQDPAYASLLAVRPLEFARLQASLPADAALIQVFPSDEKLYLFVVTSDAFAVETSPVGREEIYALARLFRREVARSGRSDFRWGAPGAAALRKAVFDLYGALAAPVEKHLAGKKTVAWIPTQDLFYVPMAALGRDVGKPRPEFLVERFEVATVAIATSLEAPPAEPAGSASLFALGNPDGTLKEAEAEVQALAGLFPGAAVYVGKEATPGRLREGAPGSRFVHLATHGVLDSRDPAASYLALAGEQGRLTLKDVYRLPLQGVRLVTLSACQTAMGSRQPGSEVTSLATAFDVAGSRAVVASLWMVDDLSTRQLMTAFYRGLQEGRDPAAALRDAQVGMLGRDEARSSPYHWAPFVLIGDWR